MFNELNYKFALKWIKIKLKIKIDISGGDDRHLKIWNESTQI